MKTFILTIASLISVNTYANLNSDITCDEGLRIETTQDGQKKIIIDGEALKQFIKLDIISLDSVNENLEYIDSLTPKGKHFITQPKYGTYFEVPSQLDVSTGELLIKNIVPCGETFTEHRFELCH